MTINRAGFARFFRLEFPARRALLGLLALGWGAVGVEAESIYRTPYTFTTLAGLASYSSNNGTGMGARFYGPAGVATDAAGNVFVADQYNSLIRKITPAGVVTTVAGLAGITGSDDGTGSAARFNRPTGIAIDAAGALYVTDTGNHTIRKVTTAGVVTTFAGSPGAAGSFDGTGGAARFNKPTDIAIDASGNLYVHDSEVRSIRRVTPAGVVSTFIASPATDNRWSAALDGHPYYYDEYLGLQFYIHGLAVDAAGNVLVSEHGTLNNYPPYGSPRSYATIRKISPAGMVSTVPGTGSPDADLTPIGKLTVTGGGDIVVATSYTLYKIAANGAATLLAGAADAVNRFEFFADGPGAQARLMWPGGVTTDAAGNIFFTDHSNIVRKFGTDGQVSTLAGVPKYVAEQRLDGTGQAARFNSIYALALDRDGTLVAADSLDCSIRRITPGGVVTTIVALDSTIGTGIVRTLLGVAVDQNGNIFATDLYNNTIVRITPAGVASIYAGAKLEGGWVDGPVADARFSGPAGITIDGAGNLYVGDLGNSVIRKITPAGVVSTVAGVPGAEGFADGPAASAKFGNPEGLVIDGLGNLYVADTSNHAIRKITPAGVVSTLAGSPSAPPGAADGIGSAATFNYPHALAIDPAGNIFVGDSSNSVVRRVTPTGEVTTVAGLVDAGGSMDGTGRNARFLTSNALAINAAGIVYAANGNTISKGVIASAPVITTQPQSQTVPNGASVTLSVVASATPAPTYQWQFNGSAISGATGSEFAISIVRSADAGEYSVVVANDAGSVTSNKAVLSVGSGNPSNPPGGGAGGGGGGGAPSTWFLLGLAALGTARFLRRARAIASGE